MNDEQIEVNTIFINYQDSGGDGTPIIFIHGFPFDKSTWEFQYEALKASNRVIAYDIRGFGKSTSNRERASMELFADDLIGLMDSLEIEQAIVCGLSMGGYILLNAVNRFPQRFKGIVLCDTQCLSDSKEGMKKRFETIRDIEENGVNEFADDFVKKLFAESTYKNNVQLVEKIKELILETAPETITAALDALAHRRESCSLLKHITVPTLVMCGKEDKLTPVPRSEFLFTTIPNAQIHLIENAGHLSNLEQPLSFNLKLDNFISSL